MKTSKTTDASDQGQTGIDLKILDEVSMWIVAASVLPFVALVVIGLTHLLGFQSLVHIVAIITLSFISAVAAVWWWWAIITIKRIAKLMDRTYHDFADIKQGVNQVKKDLDQVKKINSK